MKVWFKNFFLQNKGILIYVRMLNSYLDGVLHFKTNFEVLVILECRHLKQQSFRYKKAFWTDEGGIKRYGFLAIIITHELIYN